MIRSVPFKWSPIWKQSTQPKLNRNCGGPAGYEWAGSDADDWVPTDAEVLAIKERKRTVDRKRNDGFHERLLNEYIDVRRDGNIRIFHMPIRTDVLNTKLADEDRQEDNYGSSYIRNHCEHLACNFPGYAY